MNSYGISYQKGRQNRTENVQFYPFVSTGKEKDEETGYGYFGARYMDHELMTSWLSVDPMADKYPSISPYAYCAWNPVKLVDPEGTEIDDYFSKEGKYLGKDNSSSNNVRIIDENVWKGLMTRNNNGIIEHSVGKAVSMGFSDAIKNKMPENAALNVYQHYNPTKYRLKNLENNGESYGMRSHFVPGEDPVIMIRIEGNSMGIKVCDYVDEIKNLFSHEKNHTDLYEKIGHAKYQSMGENDKEQRAVKAQMKDKSWAGTRENFKKNIIDYGKKHGMKITNN